MVRSTSKQEVSLIFNYAYHYFNKSLN
jgi:hypothetical protein